MIRRWRKGTFLGSLLPVGVFGVSITSYFTWCYAAAIHFDKADHDLTAALRANRNSAEHKWAHHFFYPTLSPAQNPGLLINGVLIKQTTGTFFLFDASRFPHGTTIATDDVRPDDSVGLVLVQKKSM